MLSMYKPEEIRKETKHLFHEADNRIDIQARCYTIRSAVRHDAGGCKGLAETAEQV
jgi:hypothetical protein